MFEAFDGGYSILTGGAAAAEWQHCCCCMSHGGVMDPCTNIWSEAVRGVASTVFVCHQKGVLHRVQHAVRPTAVQCIRIFVCKP